MNILLSNQNLTVHTWSDNRGCCRTKKPVKSQGKAAVNAKWNSLKSQLTSFCLEAYSAWIGHTTGVMLSQFEAGLSDNRGQVVLHSLTVSILFFIWNVIELLY